MGLGKPKLRAKFEVANPSRCRYIIGETKIWGALLAQGYAHFSYGYGFMLGLGKPKLCTKFEVVSFSHCVNIEVQPQNFGPLFLLRVIL